MVKFEERYCLTGLYRCPSPRSSYVLPCHTYTYSLTAYSGDVLNPSRVLQSVVILRWRGLAWTSLSSRGYLQSPISGIRNICNVYIYPAARDGTTEADVRGATSSEVNLLFVRRSYSCIRRTVNVLFASMLVHKISIWMHRQDSRSRRDTPRYTLQFRLQQNSLLTCLPNLIHRNIYPLRYA